jgi:hypothetical protein
MTDGSREQPHMTAGLDLGGKYSYLSPSLRAAASLEALCGEFIGGR